MGQLILCNKGIAKTPYYLDNAAINIYSLEELSYYIIHNAYLIEPDFMKEEFCNWLRFELKEEKLAAELKKCLWEKRSFCEFTKKILFYMQYAKEDEIQNALKIIDGMESKNEAERKKLRADRLMQRRRYMAAISEYKQIIEMQGNTMDAVLIGNVFHNIGTAYVGMFLFAQAAEFYQKAYEKNNNPESLKEELYCLKLSGQDKEERARANQNHLGQDILDIYAKEMQMIMNHAVQNQISEKIYRWQRETIEEVYEENAMKLINEWKNDYEGYSGL